jgi:uncharacterized protein YqgC (DUF456 family)
MDQTILLFVLAALLIAVGIVGLLLPVLPGIPLLLAGLVVAAWAEGFEEVSLGTLAVEAAEAADRTRTESRGRARNQ